MHRTLSSGPVVAILALLLAFLGLLSACGPITSYSANIPPDKGENFLFYAKGVAENLGYGVTVNDQTKAVQVSLPDGKILFSNDPEDGVQVVLMPDAEPAADLSARETHLREVADQIIEGARAEAKKNEGF